MTYPHILNDDNFAQAFDDIRQLLVRFESVWRAKPFIQDTLPWQQDYPQLFDALLALDDEQLLALDDEAILLDWAAPLMPGVERLAQWAIAPFIGDIKPMAKFSDVGIKGRKVDQITCFAAAVGQGIGAFDGAIVDWCSGKGHLAKQLHHVTGSKVTCLERDRYLCECGSKEAAKLGFPIEFIKQDVLQEIPKQVTSKTQLHTALHACGDLHISMINTGINTQAKHIALSPCCYHLTQHDRYQPLSKQAQLKPIELCPKDLRLAVSQTVTAGNRVRKLRHKELLWRIGFDILQRKVSTVDEYRQTPSIQKKWLSNSFEDYCQLMAERIGLVTLPDIPCEEVLAQAQIKHHRIIRLEKARLMFRLAMEYYLVLDRVLYLQDNGYQVDLKLFCPTQVTPRNMLVLASKL